jgi:hypothetical protein
VVVLLHLKKRREESLTVQNARPGRVAPPYFARPSRPAKS